MGGLLIFLLLLALVAGLIWIGYQLAQDRLSDERRNLDNQRSALHAEWHGLEQARKVNYVFFAARDALRRAEAEARHDPMPGSREVPLSA